MAGPQSLAPEICSLICQEQTLERLDLNSICFISHAFRNEAQRELYYRFPCLRGTNRVKAWCLSLQSRPHLAVNVEGLVLLLPRPSAFRVEHVDRLTQALHMCVNLKELAVLFQERHLRRPVLQEPKYSPATHMLNDHPFKLTKFVNGYLSQENSNFKEFLQSQTYLESLEMHSGKTNVFGHDLLLYRLKSLVCSPKFLLECGLLVKRVRLDFESSPDICEIDELRGLLNVTYNKTMTSLAIFLKQKQSHFPKILRVIAFGLSDIQHLEIHQLCPTQIKEYMALPGKCDCTDIRTLVFRPPPGLPNPNLCAYVELRSPIGRRRVAEKLIKQSLPTLTRLVLVVHGNDYEFRKDLHTGVISGEILITRDTQEWSSVT